jgi:threonylcarbamoyladenosine tRNA methylthiotransferase MtaB
MVRRARENNPEAKIAVCGCAVKLSDLDADEIGADFFFDAREPQLFFRWLNAYGNDPVISREYKKRARTYIKIQDGCDRYCAYCIVPYARGPVNSRAVRDIIKEALACIKNGTREIVLTGIQTAAYGKDIGETFPDLINKMKSLPGLNRLRLGSIEPYAVDAFFIEAIHPLFAIIFICHCKAAVTAC